VRIDERTGQTIAAVGNNGATTGQTLALPTHRQHQFRLGRGRAL